MVALKIAQIKSESAIREDKNAFNWYPFFVPLLTFTLPMNTYYYSGHKFVVELNRCDSQTC